MATSSSYTYRSTYCIIERQLQRETLIDDAIPVMYQSLLKYSPLMICTRSPRKKLITSSMVHLLQIHSTTSRRIAFMYVKRSLYYAHQRSLFLRRIAYLYSIGIPESDQNFSILRLRGNSLTDLGGIYG